jgi:hypothetical protein
MIIIKRSEEVLDQRLQLLHSSDISGLDEVLELFNLLLEIIQTDLVVLNDQVDLKLLDTETDCDELGSTPDETILVNTTDCFFETLHISLVV